MDALSWDDLYKLLGEILGLIPRLKRDPKFLQATNVAHVCTTCNRLPSLLVGKAARHFPPKNGSAGHQINAGFSVIVTQRSYVAE